MNFKHGEPPEGRRAKQEMDLPPWLQDALEAGDEDASSPSKTSASPNLAASPTVRAPPLKFDNQRHSHPLAAAGDDLRRLGTFFKVTGTNKKVEFASLVWVQQLSESSAVLAVQMSFDGKHLVTGNANGEVHIYTLECQKGESAGFLFSTEPTLLAGHTAEVTQLAIHPHLFLLSASLDKTVRLWHMETTQCLGVFTHADFVTDVAWKPSNTLYGQFATTCIDGQVRLFGMVEKKLLATANVASPVSIQLASPKEQIKLTLNMCTSLAFLDDDLLVVGNVQGVLTFLELPNLTFHTQVQIEQKQIRSSVVTQVDEWNCKMTWQGSRIAGLLAPTSESFDFWNDERKVERALSAQSLLSSQALRSLSGAVPLDAATALVQGDARKLVITTADSRVRTFSVADKAVVKRFRGHKHSCRACLVSNDWIATGSADGRVVIWKVNQLETERSLKSRLLPADTIESYESFDASHVSITSITTCPDTTRSTLYSKGWRVNKSPNPTYGTIFIVGDNLGRVRIFENVS